MRFLTVILFFIALNAFGQNRADLKNINIQDGLSQSVVNDILIDTKGFCWIGTQNGLNRFDGYSFKSFYNNPDDKYSISSDYITAIAEDANDNLWIGTRTGLNKYESRKERFIHFGLPTNNMVFPEINVRSLLVDSKNFIWVLLPNYLVRINPVDLEFKIFSFGNNSGAYQYCVASSLYESNNGNIWFVNGDRLVMFDKVFEKFEFLDLQLLGSKSCINKVFEYQSKMFVATDYRVFELLPNQKLSLIHKFNSKFYVFQNKNKVFASLANGLYEFVDFKFKPKVLYKDNSGGVKRFLVTSSTIDKSSNIWIGTSGKGVFKTSISKPKFIKLERQVSPNHYLSDDQISSIAADDKYYWIGTYEYGLNRVDRKSGKVKIFNVENSRDVIPVDNIYSV